VVYILKLNLRRRNPKFVCEYTQGKGKHMSHHLYRGPVKFIESQRYRRDLALRGPNGSCTNNLPRLTKIEFSW
jgi:hypothetical protein